MRCRQHKDAGGKALPLPATVASSWMAMMHLQLEQLKGLLTPDTAPSNVDILFQNEL